MATVETQRRDYADNDDQGDRMRGGILGMSFGGPNIYFAEVMREATHFVVQKFGTIATNMKFGSGIEGVEKNIRDLNSYVSGCIEDNRIQARRLSLCLNSHLVSINRMQIDPDCSDEEFESQIKWEFNQNVLEDVDQYMVNTSNLRKGSARQLPSLLVVGVRRRFVETLSQVLEKSKIALSNMDVDILCTHATYEINYGPCDRGLTALVEAKTGIGTVALCRDFEVEQVYQFSTPLKMSPAKLGDLINHHLDNFLDMYNEETHDEKVIGRVILCNSMAKETAPFVDGRFYPEVIKPFHKIEFSDEYKMQIKGAESAGEGDKNKTKVQLVEPDYTPYAECVGAAIKLLAD